MKPPLGSELCGYWCVWWESHLSVDSSGNSHTAASSNQHVRAHPADIRGLMVSVISLSLPASPDRDTTLTVSHTYSTSMAFLVPAGSSFLLSVYSLILQLSKDLRQISEHGGSSLPWTPACLVSSITCWHHPSPLLELSRSPGIVPAHCSPSCACAHPGHPWVSFSCFEDKSTKWSDTSASGTPLPIHWHGWQPCS